MQRMTCTPPYNTRTVKYGVGSAECGCVVVVVVCVPPPSLAGDHAVSCHPWGIGALPQCPMAALAAEDGVHTTVRHPYRNSNRHKHGVGNAECGL